MKTFYLLIIIMTLVGSVASLLLKRTSDSNSICDYFRNKYLYIGIGLYLLSSVLNIIVLRRMQYSVVLPLTSLTYVWTMIFACYFLGEKITSRKILGVVCIFAGAVCVALS